ncbi:hypothetical protein GCM10028771_11560 [Nocardioides marmoraquaticus]
MADSPRFTIAMRRKDTTDPSGWTLRMRGCSRIAPYRDTAAGLRASHFRDPGRVGAGAEIGTYDAWRRLASASAASR